MICTCNIDSIDIMLSFNYEVLSSSIQLIGSEEIIDDNSYKFTNLDFDTLYNFAIKCVYFDNVEELTVEYSYETKTLPLEFNLSNDNVKAMYNDATISIDKNLINYIKEINIIDENSENIDATITKNEQNIKISGLKEETQYSAVIKDVLDNTYNLEFKTRNQFVDTFEYEILQFFETPDEFYICIKGLKNEYIKDLVIPNTAIIDGVEYLIYKIDNGFCENNSYIETLTIGVNVNSIGSLAFARCTNLKSVNLADGTPAKGGLSYLWSNVFFKCTSLETVDLKYDSKCDVLHIDYLAFYDCINLVSIKMSSDENEFCYIRGDYFIKCEKLAEIDLPEVIKCRLDNPFPDTPQTFLGLYWE